MKHLKRFRRLSLILGPIVALVMILNASGAFTISGLAYYSTGSTSCPTDASVVTGGSVTITRAGQTINATSLSGVRQGDTISVTFDLDDRCTSTNVPISLVSYKSPSASYNATTVNQRVVYQSKAGTYNKYGGTLSIAVPNCYFSTGLVYGNVIINMSSTNLYGSRQVAWQDGGTQSCGSTSTTTTTTSTCPADPSALSSYYFNYPAGNTTKKYDLSGVKQGDDVYAYFTLKAGCSNVPVSFAAYTAKEPYWNVNTASQQVYQPASNDTGTFSTSGMVHTKVPVCYYQIDFVYGGIINPLNPNSSTGLYNGNKIEWLNGGTNACGSGPGGAEVPTATPTKAATSTPTKTATSVPPTATTVPPTATTVPPTATNTATATKTAVPPTATNTATSTTVPPTATNTATATTVPPSPTTSPITTDVTNTPTVPATATTVPPTATTVPPTATTVPPTATATATATATQVPPGTILIHIRDSAGNPLDGATVKVTNLSPITVTDNAAGDEDPAIGEIKLSNLPSGGYLGDQTAAKAGYNLDTHSDSVSLTPGGTAEMTFVNTQPGNLNVLLRDAGGASLAGGCFAVNGPSGYNIPVCDGGNGDTDGASNGTVKLTGLLAGSYSGTQSSAPSGYVADSSTQSTNVPEGSTGQIVFVNNRVPGALVIKLYDDNGSPLNGGCFIVSGLTNQVCITANGQVRVEGLAPGDYRGTQATAPIGYLKDGSTQSANVPSGGEGVIEFHNTRLGSLVITLTDPNNTPLANGCYTVSGFSNPVCDTDGDGVARLDNLVPGSISATQIQGPVGYDPDPNPTKSAVVLAGDVVYINFVNTPGTGTLYIHKYDDQENNLGGACFSVFGTDTETSAYDVIICDRDDPDYGDGAADGLIALTDLVPGGYQVSEIEAPAGYILDEQAQTTDVPAGGRADLTYVNSAEGGDVDGRYIIVYKLNCETAHNRREIAWDDMPSSIPGDCALAPDVQFNVLDQNGNVVAQVTTGAVGSENEGRAVVFIQRDWGVVTFQETYNPEQVENDNIQFSYDVDFGCACQYPTTGAVNVLTDGE